MRTYLKPFRTFIDSINDTIAKVTIPRVLVYIFLFFAYIIPLLRAVISVFSGSMAFWYDPARDLFLALGNLSKLTLIGPPSGIPGVFYGPYWIWLLSLGMMVSKDPRIVTFVTATLPYFILIPLLLFQFRKCYSLKILCIIWLLFILTYDRYATQLWNPYPAPLLFLCVVSLLTFTDMEKYPIKRFLRIGLVGILTGLSINFHISFGIGLTAGILIYVTLAAILTLRGKVIHKKALVQYLLTLFSFGLGVSVMFLPFLAFEVRHGFNQIQTVIQTLASPHAVVGLRGLNDFSILEYFFGRLSDIFRLPKLLVAAGGIGIFWQVLKYVKSERYSLQHPESRLLLLLLCISFSTLSVYLSSKNPVWDYHFINVEIIFLLLLAFMMKRFRTVENLLTIFAVVLLSFTIWQVGTLFSDKKIVPASLAAKQRVVRDIIQDGRGASYAVYAYNPAIYNYDYAYLFNAEGIPVPYDPAATPLHSHIVYLIVPQASGREKDDFITYRTPYTEYETLRTWQREDGTTVIKRGKREEK